MNGTPGCFIVKEESGKWMVNAVCWNLYKINSIEQVQEKTKLYSSIDSSSLSSSKLLRLTTLFIIGCQTSLQKIGISTSVLSWFRNTDAQPTPYGHIVKI